MNMENYSSDSDESDDDYCPENDGKNLPSEESDVDDPIENDEEENTKPNNRKRKKPQNKSKTKTLKVQETEDIPVISAENLTEEEEKKKADALWADFLGDSHSAKEIKTINKNANIRSEIDLKQKSTKKVEEAREEAKKVTITEIFEFAGEKVTVTKDVFVDSMAARIKESSNKLENASSSVKSKSGSVGSTKPSFGIGALLGKIDKNNKLSTLEKTKLDWDSFKRNEGIDEELQTHNKGKDGYLERQDFLERTDLRQFDIEKNFRTIKRSNR